MHTRVAPKGTLLEPDHYDDVVADVRAFLEERIAIAEAAGMHPEQLLLDPGPDFAKTPAQTVAVLRALDALHELGRPLLLAISRKDFLGAITGRGPRERGAATLAAVAWAADAGAHVLRVHDVRRGGRLPRRPRGAARRARARAARRPHAGPLSGWLTCRGALVAGRCAQRGRIANRPHTESRSST